MSAVKKLKKTYKFKEVGRIFMGKGRGKDKDKDVLTFEIFDKWNDKWKKEKKGCVYAWCTEDEVFYIGKAGKGIRARHNNHKSSWKINGSKTGQRNAEEIKKRLRRSPEIQILGRVSEIIPIEYSIFNENSEEYLSLCGQEENFLRNDKELRETLVNTCFN